MHLSDLENPVLDSFHPGECVGELSFLDGKRPSAYVIADEGAEILRINSSMLTSLIESSHQVSNNLVRILTSRMRHGLGKITDTYDSYREQQELANTDELTGLHNRRWIDEVFHSEISDCQSRGEPVCFLMIDIDHFKQYNDNHGHLAGDMAIKTVAGVLRYSLKHSDFIARYGGEEFAILLVDTNIEDAARIAERLCHTVEASKIYDVNHHSIPSVTISIGAASMKQGQDHEMLIEEADKALYKAKNNGRNQVWVTQDTS